MIIFSKFKIFNSSRCFSTLVFFSVSTNKFNLIECENLYSSISHGNSPYKILQPSNPESRVSSVREISQFLNGHLPNAQFINLHDLSDLSSPYGSTAPSNEQFQQFMKHSNLGKNDQLVICEESIMACTRLYWLLTAYGHQNAFILNGGLLRWKKLGYPIEKGVGSIPSLPNSINESEFSYQLKKERLMRFDDLNQIHQNYSSQNKYQVVDARRVDQYEEGQERSWTHLPIADAVLQDDNRFKSSEELQHILQKSQINLSKTLIHSCRRGFAASLADFTCGLVAQSKGIKYNSTIFDGSWEEWNDKKNKKK